jgi:NADPH-dependent 2,4-dienoyl-CoA reductase/sulfur reductase-like enzyme
MKHFKYVILGGGMVAGYAAKEMVERGLKPGELAIVSAEDALPYERPPLSKGFLAGKEGEDKIRISPQEFYREHGIALTLGSAVESLDTGKRVLSFRAGERQRFEKLVIATGAVVRTLDIPGSTLPGVHYLRSLADSASIRDAARDAKKAAVVGSGFIAMEVASVLAQKGIETTMVVREDRVWKKLFTPEMSRAFESYFEKRGVRIAKQCEVKEAHGAGRLASLLLNDGTTMDCDLLVVGIGVRPATDALKGSGLDISDGVLVNEFLETAAPGVYAAGDVANYRDVLFDKRRRAEHWDNAVSQGQHCGRTLLGERKAYVHVPYFFSDVFDLSYEFWGDTEGAGDVVYRGDVSSTSFSVWWLKDKRLVAAFVMGRPDEEREAAPKWIESKRQIAPGELKADEFPAAK